MSHQIGHCVHIYTCTSKLRTHNPRSTTQRFEGREGRLPRFLDPVARMVEFFSTYVRELRLCMHNVTGTSVTSHDPPRRHFTCVGQVPRSAHVFEAEFEFERMRGAGDFTGRQGKGSRRCSYNLHSDATMGKAVEANRGGC